MTAAIATIKRRWHPLALAGVLTLVITACSNNPLDTTRAESPIAGEINDLFWFVMWIAIVVFVLVQGVILYMSRKFRVKGGPDDAMYDDEEFPEQIHGNERLEIAWTIIPAVIMAAIGVITLSTLVKLDDVEAQDRQQISHVDVVGAQWWWEYHYYLNDGDDEVDFITANEIILPVDEEVRLNVTSRDVIHSFWIPRLNGKRDAVPGRTSTWTLEASAPGRYQGQCTEFCGLSHAYMQMYTVALDPDTWTSWADNQMVDRPAPEEGEPGYDGWVLFENNCARCHVVNGATDTNQDEVLDDASIYNLGDRIIPDKAGQVSGAAPNLTHLMSRTTFAGSIFDLYENPDDIDYAALPTSGTLNRGDLEAWILNAPAEKANAATQEGAARGMPSFAGQLSGADLDNIVDYLLTLN